MSSAAGWCCCSNSAYGGLTCRIVVEAGLADRPPGIVEHQNGARRAVYGDAAPTGNIDGRPQCGECSLYPTPPDSRVAALSRRKRRRAEGDRDVCGIYQGGPNTRSGFLQDRRFHSAG